MTLLTQAMPSRAWAAPKMLGSTIPAESFGNGFAKLGRWQEGGPHRPSVPRLWAMVAMSPGSNFVIGLGGLKKAGIFPGLQSQVDYSVRCHMLCLKAVGGCQHATPPVHPTTPNRAEDGILFAASDGPQQNGIFHTLPPWFWWSRTKNFAPKN